MFPRGVLGPDAGPIADASDLASATAGLRTVAAVAWSELQPAIAAALERRADEGLAPVLALANDPDPTNALAVALAGRALADLALARTRAHERLAALTEGGEDEAVDRAVGRCVIDLLDLDVEDYEPETLAYVEADGTPDALAVLARATGDEDTRAWAREAISSLAAPPAIASSIAERLLGDGTPEDAAADGLWMATAQEIADTAIEVALAVRATDTM